MLTYGEAERIATHLRHTALVYKQDAEALKTHSPRLRAELEAKEKDVLALAEKVMAL